MLKQIFLFSSNIVFVYYQEIFLVSTFLVAIL